MNATALQAPPPLKHEVLSDIDATIRTVDAHAREIERRWGIGRLPHLVPLEWGEKFRRQKAAWEKACFECVDSLSAEDRDRVKSLGEAMLRAFAKLEQVAEMAGHFPEPPTSWEFMLKDGGLVVLVRDRAELAQIDLKGRQAHVWSLEEIAEIVARFPALAAAKDAFPGAEVVSLRTSPAVIGELDDSMADLPW